jgi:hypothetical protein
MRTIEVMTRRDLDREYIFSNDKVLDNGDDCFLFAYCLQKATRIDTAWQDPAIEAD